MSVRFSLSFCFLCLLPSVISANEPAGMIYDFGASWCGPCQQVAPLVAKLEREGLPIRKVDIDQERRLADQFHVDRVPTFVLVVNNKEVARRTGSMTEQELRSWAAKIPSATSSPAPPAQSEFQVALGEPDRFPRPDQQPVMTEENQQSSEPKASMWPFSRKEAPAPTVRGNDVSLGEPDRFPSSQPSQADAEQPANPMAATVLIRVKIGATSHVGTGTVIFSAPGNTLILSCGHVFRDFNDDSKIEVEFFGNHAGTTHVARMIKYDIDADLGIIAVPTDRVYPVAPVAGPGGTPQVGESVISIGCSGGSPPTLESIQVTELNRYDGPSTIECSGLPVEGRSGGGLFDRQGNVVGVCFAADDKRQRGIYAGLAAVHALLDDCRLTALYNPKPVTPERSAPATMLADVAPAPHPFANVETPPTAPAAIASNPATPPAHSLPRPADVDVRTAGAEVVVIVRDPSQPAAQERIVIIHNASPKFMRYLDGELNPNQAGSTPPNTPISNSGNAGMMEGFLSSTNRPASAEPPQLTRGKELLKQTTLAEPVQPRKYVRNRNPSNSP